MNQPQKTRDVAGILHFLTPQQMAKEIVRLDAALSALSAVLDSDSSHLAAPTLEARSGSGVPARPTLPGEDERARFEAAMRPLFTTWSFAPDGCGGYHAHYTETAWVAWQTCAALAASPLPQARMLLEDLLQPDPYERGRRDKEDELASVLPGVTYMDPPDGGAPTILEQLQRQAKDAARYRWWRVYAMQTDDVSADDRLMDCLTPADVDATIDRAIAGTQGEQKP